MRRAEPAEHASVQRQEARAAPDYEGFPQAQTMASFPPAVSDVFRFDELLSDEERGIRHRTRAFMVRSPGSLPLNTASCAPHVAAARSALGLRCAGCLACPGLWAAAKVRCLRVLPHLVQ